MILTLLLSTAVFGLTLEEAQDMGLLACSDANFNSGGCSECAGKTGESCGAKARGKPDLEKGVCEGTFDDLDSLKCAKLCECPSGYRPFAQMCMNPSTNLFCRRGNLPETYRNFKGANTDCCTLSEGEAYAEIAVQETQGSHTPVIVYGLAFVGLGALLYGSGRFYYNKIHS